MDRQVRISAKGLIIKDGRMAAIKIRDEGEEWFIMPGGGMESEELLPEAVEREIAEELGMRVKCGELLFVIEGLHGERFHRVNIWAISKTLRCMAIPTRWALNGLILMD